MRCSPLRTELDDRCAVWRSTFDVDVACHFGDPAREVAAVRSGTVVTDRSHRGRLRLTGPDRVTFLNGQSTSNIATLEPDCGRMTAFLNGKGKLRGVATVVSSVDELDVLCDAGAAAVIRGHLQSFIIMEDVVVADRSATTAELGVFGPGAASALPRLLEIAPIDDLKPLGRRRASLSMGQVDIIATPLADIPGFTLIVDAAAASALWRVLCEQLPVVGDDAMEVLRVEGGIAAYGVDMDDDTIPIEAGLLDLIDYEKGCFTGYEVVARIRTYGHVNRNLVGLRHGSAAEDVVGEPVRAGDKDVGLVTSSVVSEPLGARISLAMVRREVAVAGTPLTVRGSSVTVVDLPFVVAAPPLRGE